jgi:long-chain acyl-CoA synthetase
MATTAANPRRARHATPFWHREWLDFYPPDVASSLAYPNIPIYGLLERTAARFPDRPACTLFDRTITYADLWEKSWRFASALQQLGAGRGARVGMLLPNTPDYIVALHAAWMTGATVLQLSPLMVAEEIEKLIEATDCQIVVTLDLLANQVLGALNHGPLEHLVVTSLAPQLAPWKGWLYQVERTRRTHEVRPRQSDRIHSFDRLLRMPLARFLPPPITPAQDVALFVPTGGTTGFPKIVMLTHRNLVANGLQVRAWSRGKEGNDSVLAVLPFFHTYGLSVCMLSAIALGAVMHLHPRFDPRAVLEIIERHQPAIMPAVPALLAALNRAMKHRPTDLASIKAVICGASALDAGVRAEFEAAGATNIVEGYGLSEASPVTHANPLGMNDRSGTIGLPFPDTEARIMDADTGIEEMPIGTVGELVIRGPQVMAGYYNNPGETARALRGGWLYTGDLARRDADGYFTIVDRKKDIIKTSGYLVYPAEVEEVLLRFPGVGEAAVVGVPDPERGEVVRALVVPKNGPLDLAALEHHCSEHLGKHKRPRRIEVVEALPKNFLGKILRRHLREAP